MVMAVDEGRGVHPGVTRNENAYNDEISLFELVLILWRNRLTAIVTAAAVSALTMVYLLIATPVYKADVHFLPPLQQDVEALNVAKQYGLLGYDPAEAYQEFIRQLDSLALRLKFFRQNRLLDYYAPDEEEVDESVVFRKAFSDKLVVGSPGRNEDTSFRAISFEIDDAEKSATLLNGFVEYVMAATKEKLIGNVNNNIAADVAQLETSIASKRSIAKQRREDTVAKLEEALQVARKLNIQKPSDYRRDFQVYSQESESVAVNTAEMPLYTQGAIALEAEIDALANRKSDDPFIPGLRDVQERLSNLQSLVIDPRTIRVATVDRAAVVPAKPEKPKKLLVLAVGVCLAAMLGVMAAFFAEFVKGLRRQLQSANHEG